MERSEQFKQELYALLRKYNAFIELEDEDTHGYGDAFPQTITVYLGPTIGKRGVISDTGVNVYLGKAIYPPDDEPDFDIDADGQYVKPYKS